MKKSILLFAFLCIGTFVYSSSLQQMGQSLTTLKSTDEEKGIKFYEGTWEEALAKAAKEDKYIFLDAYAAWCGPCKVMAKREFVKEEVGDYFNKNFINFMMDMEKDPEGKRLGNKYEITAYPTLFIINANEEVVKQVIGYHKGKELITFGKSVK